MTAYWISVYRQITDEAKVAAYLELAVPALRAAGATFLARGLPEQTYEAGERTRTVIMEFESVDAARAAHDGHALSGSTHGTQRRRGPRHSHRSGRRLRSPVRHGRRCAPTPALCPGIPDAEPR